MSLRGLSLCFIYSDHLFAKKPDLDSEGAGGDGRIDRSMKLDR